MSFNFRLFTHSSLIRVIQCFKFNLKSLLLFISLFHLSSYVLKIVFQEVNQLLFFIRNSFFSFKQSQKISHILTFHLNILHSTKNLECTQNPLFKLLWVSIDSMRELFIFIQSSDSLFIHKSKIINQNLQMFFNRAVRPFSFLNRRYEFVELIFDCL